MKYLFLATSQNTNRKYFAWIPLLKLDILDLKSIENAFDNFLEI